MKSKQAEFVTSAVGDARSAVPARSVKDVGGRPRDATRDEAILDAAIAILGETGYERMTMDMVAVRAKAGKATVYRRWPSKAEMVIEAVARMKRSLVNSENLADTGSLRGDLLALFRPQSVEQVQYKLRAMAGVASVLNQHPTLADAGHDAVVLPWVEANRTLILRALARGEVSKDAHVDTVAKIIPSLAAYRTMVQRQPFDHAFLVETVDGIVLPALGVVIHASERDTPANRKPIEWKLIADLPVTSRREAIENSIEPTMTLTPSEIDLLNCLLKKSYRLREQLPLSRYLEKIARLAGYLARPTIRYQEILSCGVGCAGSRICSLASISYLKDMGQAVLPGDRGAVRKRHPDREKQSAVRAMGCDVCAGRNADGGAAGPLAAPRPYRARFRCYANIVRTVIPSERIVVGGARAVGACAEQRRWARKHHQHWFEALIKKRRDPQWASCDFSQPGADGAPIFHGKPLGARCLAGVPIQACIDTAWGSPSCVTSCMIFPFCKTITRCAMAIVSGRCATRMRVSAKWAIAALTACSFQMSRWLVASSSTISRGLRYNARASRIRCFCPPESPVPRSPTSVLKPIGMLTISWRTAANWALACACSRSGAGSKKQMLSMMEPENKRSSCITRGLAAAGWTGYGNTLAGRDGQIEVGKYTGLVVGVAKRHIAEFHQWRRLRYDCARNGAVMIFLRLCEHDVGNPGAVQAQHAQFYDLVDQAGGAAAELILVADEC
uniref:HTH tetR-type domain-containing protein n=1 Tax=Tanacetum cinerariifolium TaxID=118510 RepID=A0A699GIY4_TANCI|nr:hypothetical protein [Tanacetum cinerariifolium]